MLPKSLRAWFVVHFLDVAFAVSMPMTPAFRLTILGWRSPDPLMTRLVAAAGMGIGIQSLLVRNAGLDGWRAMLNLMLI